MLYSFKSIPELDNYYIDSINFVDDCKKIQQAFFNHAIQLTLLECQEIYENYSDESYCSQWENGIESLELEDIFELLLPFLKQMLNDKGHRLFDIIDELEENKYWEEEN